ncbi:MAG: ATP-binding protein, partial [Ignavibacteriae bacterium]|nr:ATP-binding protein [Ignavibacteriota bacterium]
EVPNIGLLKLVTIMIEDSGPGIAHNLQEKIFLEGFSTKEFKTKIKGFGLFHAKSIIKDEMKGYITLESPVLDKKIRQNISKNGTRFIIKLHQYPTKIQY